MTAVLDTAGPAAPPRANGELVFAEPWESRAFGMAVSLADAGAFTWDAFRDRLVARIAAWEAEHGAGGPGAPEFRYYACWLDALEDVLVDGGALGGDDVAARSTELAARPAGHDHRDDEHGHGHGH
ncbi:nitrile hydratase accessory protein [Actinomycetospora succinea]|uniref:Nitrile hydratase accessory protein n=1 Tax=Actinomycetospora succinea TaxID=663603 RepID=A0A4R6VQR3_9PSEU|nr:nitrile hydratase accessory protein [Actinomycetospora succinea]TDQ64864.1 nitrile hydratase accessory protein [Actinomycetospora succinea]